MYEYFDFTSFFFFSNEYFDFTSFFPVVQPSLNFGSTTTASTATVAPLSFGSVASSAAPTAIGKKHALKKYD